MMLRRVVALIVSLALTTLVLLFSATPDATASERSCEAVALPRLANADRFPGLPDEITPNVIVDDVFGGDVEETIEEFGGASNDPGLPSDLQMFTGDVVAFLLNPPEACAASLAYDGPFATSPTAPTAVFGFDSITAIPAPDNTGVFSDAGPATAAPSASAAIADTARAELAVTGSESEVMAFFGAGLVGFGALALGIRRRMS